MAHGTRINGTAYGITGGKCLVGGTEYAIKKGRTLIGGTGYDISFGPELLDAFSDNSWEAIIWACQNNAVPSTWNVADSKPMTINNTSYQIDIIGKNHDTYTAGGTAPLTFQMHDCYLTEYRLSSSSSNTGGYSITEMHTTTLPAILSSMPSEVQSGIKQVNKLTLSGAYGSVETIACKLFLLSEIEIFGSTTYSGAGEGSRYAYYSSGNSAAKDRNHSFSFWWERSPCKSSSYYFCTVNGRGKAEYTRPTDELGVSFAFCF